MLKGRGKAAMRGRCSVEKWVLIEDCRSDRTVLGAERVRAVVAARQLVLVLVVVIVDGPELQSVRSQNLGHIAVRRVIDVVVVIGTECGEVGGKVGRPNDAWNATEEILEGHGTADGRLDVR